MTEKLNEDKRSLKAKDVAALLHVSQRHVWRLNQLGILPQAFKFGGSTRWRQADIMAWIQTGYTKKSNHRPRG